MRWEEGARTQTWPGDTVRNGSLGNELEMRIFVWCWQIGNGRFWVLRLWGFGL